MNDENIEPIDLAKKSDEEIFDILTNPEEYDNDIYKMAIKLAQDRELISNYQATGLIAGDLSVLEYNPNKLENQEQDYPKVEKPRRIKKTFEQKLIQSGLNLSGLGLLIIAFNFFIYSNRNDWFLYGKYSNYIIGALGLIVGITILIMGLVIKRKKIKERNKQFY